MGIADVKARAAFVARFRPKDRVHTPYGPGTIRAIAANFAYVACDSDAPFADERSTAGCRVVLFDGVEALADAQDRFADEIIRDLESRTA